MSRGPKAAKNAGTSMERRTADYLAQHVDDRIDRRVKTGAKDRGDIGGVRIQGQRVVLECKDYGGRIMAGPWLNEAEIERGNDDALAGFVVAKRRGKGDPGDQLVIGTLRDLAAILSGKRPVD